MYGKHRKEKDSIKRVSQHKKKKEIKDKELLRERITEKKTQ
jgi:hypothetical protein